MVDVKMYSNKIQKSEITKLSFTAKSNIFDLFPSCFSPLSHLHLHLKAPPVAQFTNSDRLNGRQRRMMGKWVLGWQIGSLWSLPLCVAPVSSQPVLWFERKASTRVGSVGTVRCRPGWHLNRWHPEDGHASVSPWRHAEWQTRGGVSRCLAFCPSAHPPVLTPHYTPAGLHMLLLCSRTDAVCSVKLRVKFTVCVPEASIQWLPGNSSFHRSESSSVSSLAELIQHSLTLNSFTKYNQCFSKKI